MSNEDLKVKVFNIVGIALGLAADSLNIESSPDTVPEWTSLKSMNIVLALEQELKIEFSDDQISEMLNMELILAVIEEAQK